MSIKDVVNQLNELFDVMVEYNLGSVDEISQCLSGLYSKAKFSKGDRVKLARTPKIDRSTAPGWMGAKHFLIEGASGKVVKLKFMEQQFWYWVVFDNESWIDLQGNTRKVSVSNRGIYLFTESYLVSED